MELVEGETLADWIANGPMNLGDFQELASQTMEAVLAAHSLSLLHRDLKPENIKVQRLPGGRIQIKVLDFGLARLSYGAKKMTEDQLGNIMGPSTTWLPSSSCASRWMVAPICTPWVACIIRHSVATAPTPTPPFRGS
ncbi:protein kinase domain-containing protein [Verrucomicrobium spinosum]|uniref:protein kinase domain-containing protein n=1 Tax=Verrucomicrobium spinosum TaxID=2736 RepID=UPI00210BA659|nr:protein kinase [Verrucomicrobium spinosum]